MGLKIDGIATNGNLDSSGEVLNVAGHDISDLVEGKGVLNWEHEKSAEDILGAVIYAKKIMSLKDCENDRQKMYFDMSDGPYVYIIVEFFEDEMHPPAVAAAAMIRYYAKKKEKLLAGFSIEGQTLERDGNKLERSVGRRVALTLRPCNKSAIAGLYEDPRASEAVKKSEQESKIKSYEIENIVFDDPILDLKQSVIELNKTLTAGGGNVAPSQLTGGAALTPEHITPGVKNRMKAALRDWDRTRPLKEVIKAALPEVSDNYIDHFVHLAEDISLKKGMPALKRIGPEHSNNPAQNDEQKKLIDGLYWDEAKHFDPGHDNFGEKGIHTMVNDAGDHVLVKNPSRVKELSTPEGVWMKPMSSDTAQNSAVYYAAAKDFFGLGNNVPATNYFHNPHQPHEKRKYQAMKFLKDAEPLMTAEAKKVYPAFTKARENGTLHKLALMDLIMGGHGDRHDGNVMIDKAGEIHHIDNDQAFHHTSPARPIYYENAPSVFGGGFPGIERDTLHQGALQWINGLNAHKLHDILKANGTPEKAIHNTVAAFMTVRHLANKGKTIGEMHQAVSSMPIEGEVKDASLSG